MPLRAVSDSDASPLSTYPFVVACVLMPLRAVSDSDAIKAAPEAIVELGLNALTGSQ